MLACNLNFSSARDICHRPNLKVMSTPIKAATATIQRRQMVLAWWVVLGWEVTG